MPVKIGTLLKEIADKSGIKTDTPEFAPILAIDTPIEDSIADKMRGSVFTSDEFVSAAKNNSTVSDYFKATIFNGMDKKIAAIAKDNNLSQADIDEINAERSSYEKWNLLHKKATAAIEAKSKPGDHAKLIDEIKKLNQEIAETKDLSKKEIEKILSEKEAGLLDNSIESFLATQKYANEDTDLDVNITTARSVLNKELAARGAKVVRGTDGKLKLINANNPELDYMENNKAVNFNDLTTSVLANKKLLKVSDAATGGSERKTVQTKVDGKIPDVSGVLSAIQTQLAQPGMQVQV